MPSGLTHRFHHFGIKPKFVATFISASLISMLVGSLVIKASIEELQLSEHFKLAQTIANQEKQLLLSAILPDVAISKAIASDRSLQKWAQDEFNPTLKAGAMTEFGVYGKLFSSGQFFYIVDKTKNYYTNHSQDKFFPTKVLYQLDLSKPNFNWYTDAIRTSSEYLINLDNDEYTGEVSVWVNAPIRNGKDIVGLAGTGFPITDFLEIFRAVDSEKSINMVVDASGGILVRAGEFFLDRYSLNKGGLKSRSQLKTIIDDKEQYKKLQRLLVVLKENPSQAVSLSLGVEGKLWSVGISYLPELDWYNFSLINMDDLVNNQSLEASFTIFLISTFTLIVFGLILVDKTILSKIKVLHRKVDESYQHDGQRPLVMEGDELAQLEAAFEIMSNTLHANMVDLESKVSKRTQLLKEKNLQLIELALTDPLTGLLNRRGLVERFGIEVERSRRENRLIGVVMVDIDDFKKVNDQYGHDVGDAVIRSCSAIIAETCRTTDVAARWGGEEFLVVIPGVNVDVLKSILKRMLGQIREFRLSTKHGELSYTVSMGAVIMNPAETDMDAMIGSADSALYSVKNEGKNNFYITGC